MTQTLILRRPKAVSKDEGLCLGRETIRRPSRLAFSAMGFKCSRLRVRIEELRVA
jgi:hypothetical protein